MPTELLQLELKMYITVIIIFLAHSLIIKYGHKVLQLYEEILNSYFNKEHQARPYDLKSSKNVQSSEQKPS